MLSAPHPESNPKLSAVRKVVIFLVGLLIFAGTLALLVPVLVRESAGARIDRAGAALNGVMRHDDIRITGIDSLYLSSLTFTDPDQITLSIEDIDIVVDPFSLVTGGRRIKSLTVGHASVTAGTPERPVEPGRLAGRIVSGILGRASSFATNQSATPNVPAESVKTRRPRMLPEISVERIDGQVYSRFFNGRITGGNASLKRDADSLEAYRQLGSATVNLKPDKSQTTYTIVAQADLAGGFRPQAVTATISPPISGKLRGMDVEAESVTWKKSELHLAGVRTRAPSSNLLPGWITARDVMVRFKPLAQGSRSAMDVIPKSLVRYVPRYLEMLMNAVSITEIRITRPVLNVAFGESAPDKDNGEGSLEIEAGKVDLAKRTAGYFDKLVKAVESTRATIVSLADEYTGIRMAVTGATVNSLQTDQATRNPPWSLSNMDLQVNPDKDGRLAARVRFESPESRSTMNEFSLAIGPENDVRMTLKSDRVIIAPYRSILPGWLGTGKNTAIEDTDLVINIRPDRTASFNGRLNLSDLDILIPEVASSRMRDLDIGFSGSAEIDGPAGKLVMNDSVASIGSIRIPFSFSGTSMSDRPVLSLQARVDRIDGEKLVESIPDEAIPVLADARLEGTFAATMNLKIDTGDIGHLVFEFAPDMADLVTVDLGSAVNLELLRSSFLHRIEDDNKVITRRIGTDSDGWTPYADIPQHMIKALTMCEDARFFQHKGFSRAGIQRSLKVNLERGGFFQGASTLSQQLVKNLFLSREKTLSRKLQEAFITWQVEKNLPKEKILELYLNVIEWGPDVWGIKEAANHYFGKAPEKLSVLESAFLVLIIPSPAKYHKYFEERRVPGAFMKKIRRLVDTLHSRGVVSDLQAISAAHQGIRFVDTDPADTVPDNEFSD